MMRASRLPAVVDSAVAPPPPPLQVDFEISSENKGFESIVYTRNSKGAVKLHAAARHGR